MNKFIVNKETKKGTGKSRADQGPAKKSWELLTFRISSPVLFRDLPVKSLDGKVLLETLIVTKEFHGSFYRPS